MPSNTFSERLLRAHAKRPDYRFYGVEVLPGIYRDSDLEMLDAAYDELVKEGLIAKTNVVVSFFGRPTPLYEITDEGMKYAAREAVT